jgi:hypothetical protein
MINPHWIPTHRGAEDKARFARWNPAYVKLVCIDERPPYLEDMPAGALIVIRNHPMSELYGNRSLTTSPAAHGDPGETNLAERYDAYFAEWHAQRAVAGMMRPSMFSAIAGGAGTSPQGRTPEAKGADHAACCTRMAAYAEAQGIPRGRLLFEGLNEPQLWANEPPALVARYYKAFLQGLHAQGLRGVVGNFGVGWPGNGGPAGAPPQWEFFAPVIEEMDDGDYLGLHEYWALNGPAENWRWWAGRFLQCPFDVRILITECGIDTGVAGPAYGGWCDLPGAVDEKARRYVLELWEYARACAQDPRIRGIFPFTYDIGGKEWERFDIRSEPFLEQFWSRIAAAGMPIPGAAVDPTPEPEPEPTPAPAGFAITGQNVAQAPNPGLSYVFGFCRFLDADGEFVKYASDATKRVRLRWRGNLADAIEPVQPGPHTGYPDWPPGYFSIPLSPNRGQWELAAEDLSRGIMSPWLPFDTDGTQLQVTFDWTPAAPQTVTLPALREAAWNRLAIPFNPTAALSRYARDHGLGNPLTAEFDAGQYRAQGFALGIVYAVRGEWGAVTHMPW